MDDQKFYQDQEFDLHCSKHLVGILEAQMIQMPQNWLLGVLRSAFCVLRSAFCVLRSAFCVLRSAFCVLRSAFCVLRSAFCVLRSAFCVLRSAFGKLPLPVITYNPALRYILSSSPRCTNVFKAKPFVAFRRSNNLSNILVSAKLHKPSTTANAHRGSSVMATTA